MSALVNYSPDAPPLDLNDPDYNKVVDSIRELLTEKQNWRYAAAIARHALFSGISFGTSSLAALCYRILHGMLTSPERNYVPMGNKMVDVLAALDNPDPAVAVAEARRVIIGSLIRQRRSAP